MTKGVLRETEELFRITFEQAPVGIAHVTPNGRFIRVNQRFCEIVKYSREEMLSMTFQDLTLAEDIDKDLTSLRKMLKGELKTYSREKQHLCKDNSTVWVNLTISLTRNQLNEPNYFISVLEDISTRKIMENALKESESRYKNIIKNTKDVIMVTGFNGKHMYVSPRYKELFGRTPEQLDKSLFDYIHPDDQSKLRDIYKKSFENKFAEAPNQEFEFRVLHQNGTYIWVSSITKNYYDEEGKVVGLITSLRDIRKRKETEKMLIESKSRYRNIIENTTDVIIVTGFDGKHLYVSPRYKDLFGRTPEQLDKFLIDYLHPDDQPKLRELYNASFEKKTTEAPNQEFEFRVQHQNGRYIWVSIITKNYYNEDKKVVGWITTLRDISKRKKAEEKLIESEKKYRHLFESSPYFIGLIDENGTLIDCNSSISDFLSIHTKDDIIGKSILEILSIKENNRDLIPLMKNLFQEAYSGEQRKSYEFKLHRSAGGILWLKAEGSTIEINNHKLLQFIVQDITERKIFEEDLKESEIKFRTIAEQSFLGIALVQDGIFKYFNQQIMDINGYSREEIQNWSPYEFLKFLHPEDRQFVSEQARKKESGDKDIVRNTKYRTIKKSGEIVWVENFSKTISYKGGTADLVMTEDVTDKVLAEQKLKESEKKYRHLFESSPYVIVLIDENGIIIDCNSSVSNFFSTQKNDLIGKTIYEVVSEVEENKYLIPTFQKLISDTYSNDQGGSIEFKLHRSVGGFAWLKIEGSMFEIDNQLLIQFIVQDITDRKIIEEDLKESEIKFRTIAEQSHMGIGILQDEEIKYANKKLANMYGYIVEEFIGKMYFNLLELVHPEDRGKIITKVEKRKERIDDTITYYQFRAFKKTGELFWVELYSRIIIYQGKNARLFTIFDITEMKEAELKLKESEEKFRRIFEANPSGMHLYDLTSNGNLIFKGANKTADKILKIDNNQNIGKTIEEAFPPLIDTEIPAKYRLVASEGLTLNWEYFDYKSEQINGAFEIYAFQTAPGSMVSSFIDITDRIEAEQRLKEMNRLKGELLRRASHELRTPLTSINGAVDLLLTIYKEDFDEKTEEFLTIIKKGGERLENLIKDLLNVSSLQTEIVEINKLRENIVKLIISSIDEIEIFAAEREININFNQEESIYINVDKNKILQVFMNLLMNAIKYTPPKGEISIKIEIHTENLIDIIIKDTGIGFTEEEKKIIFKQFGKIERFGQGFDVITEGSGLGLYISKELVNLHSGQLWVESEGRNKGSSFIIRLPKF